MLVGKAADKNPLHAKNMEWEATSTPPHGNCLTDPVAYRCP